MSLPSKLEPVRFDPPMMLTHTSVVRRTAFHTGSVMETAYSCSCSMAEVTPDHQLVIRSAVTDDVLTTFAPDEWRTVTVYDAEGLWLFSVDNPPPVLATEEVRR